MDIIARLTSELGIRQSQTEAAVKLLDEGNTVPFIARYRKELHGSMDDTKLRELSERLEYLRNLDKRREEVRSLIAAQEKLTDEISASLDEAKTITEIDDIYRPFRPKRKTRASVAKEKGLEPLAVAIYEQKADSPAPIDLAAAYIDEEKGVASAEGRVRHARQSRHLPWHQDRQHQARRARGGVGSGGRFAGAVLRQRDRGGSQDRLSLERQVDLDDHETA